LVSCINAVAFLFFLQITYDDIKKTYGGGPMRSYYSGAYSSSTNAYMLMYRQIDKQRNCEAMTVDEFPAHIKVDIIAVST
jgi:ubiquitin carboxyl-terminal hydrolase 47